MVGLRVPGRSRSLGSLTPVGRMRLRWEKDEQRWRSNRFFRGGGGEQQQQQQQQPKTTTPSENIRGLSGEIWLESMSNFNPQKIIHRLGRVDSWLLVPGEAVQIILHPWSCTNHISIGKSPFFNRKYIFIHGGFPIVMLVIGCYREFC